jgi:Spy/CpxP family protein refolding chaperone
MKVSTRALLLVGLVFVVGTVFGGLVGARIAFRQLGLRPPAEIGDAGQLPGGPGEMPPLEPPGTRLGSPPGSERSFPGRPGQRPQTAGLGRMIRQLELDENQRSQVRKILQGSHKKQMAANEQHQKHSRKIRRETLEEIRAVLKPEQAKQLQRMIRRLNEQPRRGRERRPF